MAASASSSKAPPPLLETPDERAARAISLLYHATVTGEDSAFAALNAILQGPYYNADSFAKYGNPLRPDVSAFSRALSPFGLSLLPREKAFPDLSVVSAADAFLCRNARSWFCLRRFGAHWINLNQLMQRPAQLVAEHLGVCLKQLEDDGHDIYAVVGRFPPCKADSDPLFLTSFDWGLVGGLFLPSSAVADEDDDDDDIHLPGMGRWEPEHEEYEQLLAESAREAYQDDLQAAIAASLMDRSIHSGRGTNPSLSFRAGSAGAGRSSGTGSGSNMRVNRASASPSTALLITAGTEDIESRNVRSHRRPREEIEDDYGNSFEDTDDDDGLAAAISESLKDSRSFSGAGAPAAATGGSREKAAISLPYEEHHSLRCETNVALATSSSSRLVLPVNSTANVARPIGAKLPWPRIQGVVGENDTPSSRLRDPELSSIQAIGPSKLPVVGPPGYNAGSHAEFGGQEH